MRYIILLVGSNYIKLLDYAQGYILRTYTVSKKIVNMLKQLFVHGTGTVICLTTFIFYALFVQYYSIDPQSQLTYFNRYMYT